MSNELIILFGSHNETEKQYNTIEAAFIAKLLSLDIGEVYAGWIPEPVYDCIVMRRLTGGREQFLEAKGTEEVQPRFALDIWGLSLEDVFTKAEAIRKSISGFRGYWGTKKIDNCHIVSQTEQHEGPTDATDNWQYRIVQEYFISSYEDCAAPGFLRQAAFDNLPQSLFRYLGDFLDIAQVKGTHLDQVANGADPFCLLYQTELENQDDLRNDGDVQKATYTFDVYAKTYEQAKHRAIDLRLLLDGLTGTIGSTNILNIQNLNEVDTVDYPTDASNEPLFLLSQDFDIFYNSEQYIG